MLRRDIGKAALAFAFASERYARASVGLAPLKITDVKAIPTRQWVFLKFFTSEPGLYGIGSASNAYEASAVVTAIEQKYKPFWIAKSADRIEDLWDSTNFLAYWRNSTIQNNILSGLDMALWDIKGKRARMPVYDLLGGEPGLGIDLKEDIALKYPPTPVKPGDSWTTVRGMDGSLVNP